MAKKTSTTTKITGATSAQTTASSAKPKIDVATKNPAAQRPIQGASAKPQIDGATRDRLIREQAYYNAQSRGFNGGDEMQDWLAAERIVDTRFEKTF